MEPRQMLSATVAPIQLGVVYYEDANRNDVVGDTFTITFSGGAPGTQLTRLVIDGDKDGQGLSPGDCFFDTQPGGGGAFGAVGFSVVSKQGIQTVTPTVADGGTRLVLDLVGFEAGDRLVISIDVDEYGPSSVAEGIEFEGSILTGTFTAAHYHNESGSDIFLDSFNAKLAGSGLTLPNDDYGQSGEDSLAAYTAGAFVTLQQRPLPASLAGTVFVDANMDNLQQSGERGLEDVRLTLYALDGTTYVATGRTADTDASGHYRFDNLLPGTYRVVETQPSGLFSVGARAGTVDGATRGQVTTVDIVSGVNLLGGNNSVGNDFAEAEPAKLSGWVFADDDNDGHRDDAEAGIGGVTVRVIAVDSGAVREVQTASTGYWFAANLAPGNYRVEEIQPAAYLDGKDEAGSAGGTAHNPGDLIDGIRLGSGQNGINYNFGEIRPASLAGIVYVDPDGDLVHDPGELLLAGVTVRLFDASGNQVASTQTNDQGAYQFTRLMPGTYRVEETQPAGYYDSADRVGSAGGVLIAPDGIGSIALRAGTNATGYDFTELEPASIAGRVYAQPGEELLPGVTVKLYDLGGNLLATTTTNAAGQYSFTNLRPGTYRVEEIQPAGYFDSTDYVGTAGGVLDPSDAITSIVLGSGVAATGYDFSEIRPSSLSGRVYAQPGEELLPGVTIKLYDLGGNLLATTTTNTAGQYSFTNLRPGSYRVEEIQPAGYFDSTDFVGTAGGGLDPSDAITSIVIGPGVHATGYDFSEIRPSSISGRVYAQPGEELLPGVTIKLYDLGGNLLATTTTNTAGQYSFTNLRPGSYRVEEIQPAGYFDSTDYVGTAGGVLDPSDAITSIVIGPGVDATGYDFSELKVAHLSGFVYVDDNNNGLRDAGEAPIGGVSIMLVDALGNSTGRTTTTAADGSYRFTNLAPGTYGVVETQPAGYKDGLDAAGSAGGTAENPGDRIMGVVLPSGADAREYNFGELRPVSISGRVHAELDMDCILDPGEWPIPGVTIYLLDAAGARIATTTTDAEGYYLFADLAPGLYGVEEVQPQAYIDGKDHVGTAGGWLAANDRITGASLTGGVAATGYNFCEIVPASISGYVFQDGPVIQYSQLSSPPDPATVRDGRFDPGDKPIAGVTLTLGDATGMALTDAQGHPITAVTDANGYYEFTGLAPGVYTILEKQPANYIDSLDTPGTKGGIAINPNQNIDPLLLEQLAVNPNNDAIIRITLTAGDQAQNYNFSEVVMQKIPFWIPPTPPSDPFPEAPRAQPTAGDVTQAVSFYSFPQAGPQMIFLGGSSPSASHTWHLSVLNGGQPRRLQDGMELSRTQMHTYFNVASWSGMDVRQSYWIIADAEGRVIRKVNFGIRGALPVVGDWNGDGTAQLGVFLGGEWFLDLNGNNVWDEGDLWAQLGREEDQPVAGDWDGDGKTDIGIFGPAWADDPKAIALEPGQPDPDNAPSPAPRYKNVPPSAEDATSGYRTFKHTSHGKLRADVIDHVFHYGAAGDRAIVGDWNGDGVATIAVFRGGTWYLDVDGDGKWSRGDVVLEFGQRGDLPLVGDWNGDGIDNVGIFRNGVVILDTNANHKVDDADRVFELGQAGDLAVAGDFDGDGRADVAVYRDMAPSDTSPQAAEPHTPKEVASRPEPAAK